MSDKYSEIDRLILDRWTDVIGLIDSQRTTEQHIEEALDLFGERLTRWVREQGFDGAMDARRGEYDSWRPTWHDRRKGAKVLLTLGGFCPVGYRKVDEKYPYIWVNTYSLEDFKLKSVDRVRFAQGLKASLGDASHAWEEDDVHDADHPLGQYLRKYDSAARVRLVMDSDAFVAFGKEHLRTLFNLADAIDAQLQKSGI